MNNHTTNVVLDEKFTNSVRSSVQGSLASDLKSDMSPVISSIMVTGVLGAGVGIYFNKSPILFGMLGGVLGGVIIKLAEK
tara:strand:- start:194 stop:433 length:240 start_codon:yes stop_codon:yes gene_type:complete